MITCAEVELRKQAAIDLGRYGIYMAVVLSMIVSLAVVVIISKKDSANLWIEAAVFAIPIPIALYFKNRIALLGSFAYLAVLFLALGAAVVFGI